MNKAESLPNLSISLFRKTGKKEEGLFRSKETGLFPVLQG